MHYRSVIHRDRIIVARVLDVISRYAFSLAEILKKNYTFRAVKILDSNAKYLVGHEITRGSLSDLIRGCDSEKPQWFRSRREYGARVWSIVR